MKFIEVIVCFVMVIAVDLSSAIPVAGGTIIASSEEIHELPNNPWTLLIDVRKALDFVAQETIGGSVNIPLNKLENVFQNMSDEDFAAKFNKPKPAFNSAIILSGRNVEQSQEALVILLDLHYTNVKIYQPGWNDPAAVTGIPQI